MASLFGGLALVAAGLLWWYADSTADRVTEQWLGQMRENTEQAAETLDEDLSRLAGHAETLAERLETEKPSVEELEDQLWTRVEEHPYIFGLGIVSLPSAWGTDTELFSRYLVRRGGEREMVSVEDHYDYTDSEWFREFRRQPGWYGPAYGEIGRALLTLYCTPFQLPVEEGENEKDGPDGLACVSYSVQDIWDLVADLGLGQTGYPMLLSDDGQLIAHPRREYVRGERDIDEIAEERGTPELRRLAELATTPQTGVFDYFDQKAGQKAWMYYRVLPETEWTLATVAYAAEIPRDWSSHRQRHIAITIAAIVAFICAIVAVVATREFSTKALWIGSVVVALLFLLGIGRVWQLAALEADQTPEHATLLLEQARVESQIESFRQRIETRFGRTPTTVPLGMVVEHIELEEPHQFTAKGLIWCRYSIPEHDDLARRIMFPDATEVGENTEEIFRVQREDGQLVGWSFEVTIRQPSNVLRFPLNIRFLQIRVWHPELHRHVVHVPELEAYGPLYPGAQPGMQEGARIPGWAIHRTFFAYRFHDYGVDFGPRDIAGRSQSPELAYHVVVRRHAVNAFLSNQIPVLVAILLLFILLILETGRTEKAYAFGFETLKLLTVATAIFFTLVLAHTDIRGRFPATDIMYLEYFYIVSYLITVAVAINGYLLSAPQDYPMVQYRDNLISKLLYWPLVLGAFFVVTVLVFW